MEEHEPSSNNANSETVPEDQDICHPWPYLRESPHVVSFKNDWLQMLCDSRQTKNHQLLAYKTNQRKDMQVRRFFYFYFLFIYFSSHQLSGANFAFIIIIFFWSVCKLSKAMGTRCFDDLKGVADISSPLVICGIVTSSKNGYSAHSQ